MKRAGGFRFSYSGSIVNRLVETTMPARFPFSSRRIKHALLLSAAAAACAAPLLAVHAEPASAGLHKVRSIHRLETGEPYALVRADSRMSMTGNNVSSEQLEALKGSV